MDTCKLLTPTEIEATLGKKQGEPVREELMTPGAEKCRWPSADGSDFQLAQIIFQPRALASRKIRIKGSPKRRRAFGRCFPA